MLARLYCCILLILPQGIVSEISNVWLVHDATENENPEKITGIIGKNLIIPCRMEYNLTFFAWFFCQSDCGSPNSWMIVVKIDHGSVNKTNQQKFDIDFDGALIMKNIQPSNNENWVKCKYKKPFVGMDHRTTIIYIAQESPTITINSVKDHVVFENMPLFLECDAKGFPLPWLAWIWKDKVLQNNTNGPNNLLRRHVTTEEAGNYTCMTGNSIGNTSFTYQVTVKMDGPPQASKAPPGKYSTAETCTSTVESKTASQAPPTGNPDEWKGPAFWSLLALNIAVLAGVAMYYFLRHILQPNFAAADPEAVDHAPPDEIGMGALNDNDAANGMEVIVNPAIAEQR